MKEYRPRVNLSEGVRDDGTVEGCSIETYYRPLKYVVPMLGYLRLIADDNATDIETRLPTEMLVQLGWTPPPYAPSPLPSEGGMRKEMEE